MPTQAINVLDAQGRGDQLTLWLYNMLRDDEVIFATKRDAVEQVVGYVARLFKISGESIELSEWLEPLWNSWLASRNANPPRLLTSEEIEIAMREDVKIEYAPLSDVQHWETALQPAPALAELLIRFPLDRLVIPLPPPPSTEAEDVEMQILDSPTGKPKKYTAEETPLKKDKEVVIRIPAKRARGGKAGRSAAAKRHHAGDEEPPSTVPSGTAPPEAGQNEEDTTGTSKPGASRKSGEAIAESKLKRYLADPAFLHRAIKPGEPGACGHCTKKGHDCIVAEPGAMIDGKVINWSTCGLCQTGKTKCVPVPTTEGTERDLPEGAERDLSEGTERDLSEGTERDLSEGIERDLSERTDRDLPEGTERDFSEGAHAGGQPPEPSSRRGQQSKSAIEYRRPLTVGHMEKMFKTMRADLRAHEARVRSLIGENDAVYQDIRIKYDNLAANHASLHQLVEGQLTRIVNSVESLADTLNLKDRLKAEAPAWPVSDETLTSGFGRYNYWSTMFLADVEAVAQCVRAIVSGQAQAPVLSRDTGLTLEECQNAGFIIATAIRNPIQMPWSAFAYASALPPRPHGRDGAVEEGLASLFPPLNSFSIPTLSSPHVVVDCNGRVLAWYLPHVLAPKRRVSMNDSKDVWTLTESAIKCTMWQANAWLQCYFKGGNVSGNWRSRRDLFRQPTQSPLTMPGEVNISPAWFEMARDVRTLNSPPE
ncbi:hypothetical protein HWV62_329 [Athelia sp. TMB]|nr:hypothetical protein HWV62_329 [Athelia sp. TMB]